jgi:hypothetical protein
VDEVLSKLEWPIAVKGNLDTNDDTESASVVVDLLTTLKELAQGQLGAIVRIPNDPAGTRMTGLTDIGSFIATRKRGQAFYPCGGE